MTGTGKCLLRALLALMALGLCLAAEEKPSAASVPS